MENAKNLLDRAQACGMDVEADQFSIATGGAPGYYWQSASSWQPRSQRLLMSVNLFLSATAFDLLLHAHHREFSPRTTSWSQKRVSEEAKTQRMLAS